MNVPKEPVARVQLALNVSDLDEAIDFYARLFDTPPANVGLGYANFTIADPPLKLVLIEEPEARGAGVAGALNDLGVEVMNPDGVRNATHRLRAAGLRTLKQQATTCCYAIQDKVWVKDPDDTPWEVYAVLADAPAESRRDGDGSCCAPAGVAVASPDPCC
jgi:catechol 2,3-dioxygenase-like lactoylglutathione lyase family enzyme